MQEILGWPDWEPMYLNPDTALLGLLELCVQDME